MPTDYEICMELLNRQVIVEMTKVGESSNLELTEGEQQTYKVEITNVPNCVIAVKSDNFTSPNDFFGGTKSECKRADYVLIDTVHKKIIYVELKNAKPKNVVGKEVTNQLKGAYCLIQYCKAIVNEYWDESDFLKNYDERFVCFNLKSNDFNSQKQTNDESRGSSADNFLPINGQAKYLYKKLANLR